MTGDASAPGNLRRALAEGCDAVVAWAEVLDRINVFPIADGDTGRNLVSSLLPLRDRTASDATVSERLLLAARGSSGNIACAFVRTLLEPAVGAGLGQALIAGAARARAAVADPQPGTMLTLLDAMACASLDKLVAQEVPALLRGLAEVVQATTGQLAVLREASVVDSGALGMLVFLDGTLRVYFGLPEAGEQLARAFSSLVRFDRAVAAGRPERGVCIDAVVRVPEDAPAPDRPLAQVGREVVALRDGPLWKIHLHADDADVARAAIGELGEVLAWSWDDLQAQTATSPALAAENDVHVVTDGAASLSREAAAVLGVTLLDSYVDLAGRSLPETGLAPEDVYRVMRRGGRVSTAQASTHERHLCYARLVAQWRQVLYLCVGSVYTGNHAVACAWCASHPAGQRLTVVDSGAASGRLAVVVHALARAARSGARADALAALATAALPRAEEYIFVERLEYLARGGRLSKTGARIGDVLGLAPVVSPLPDGVRRLALLRTSKDRLAFASQRVAQAAPGYVLVQYTDNRDWVESTVAPRLRQAAPGAEVALGPLSLTTGVHTGPGTWAVAVLPRLG